MSLFQLFDLDSSRIFDVHLRCWFHWEMGLIGNIAISLMVGAVIVFGAASVSRADTELVLYASVVAFFANLAREIIKDCEDMETDEGRKTLPRIGLMNARATAYVFT